MSKVILSSLACLSLVYGVDNFLDIFKEGTTYGNIKYYYIQTDKQNSVPFKDSSANANAIGGTLGFKTSVYHGVSGQATFMTTNGFNLNGAVDTSILGRDNGVRLDNGNPSDMIAQESFSILGEAFINYSYENFNINYGRQVFKTPLMDAKEVRMLPSAVEGSKFSYILPTYNVILGGAYLSSFKQRTSDKFVNIINHALGSTTKEIMGSTSGNMYMINVLYKDKYFTASMYDCYAEDFLNAWYGNIVYTGSINEYMYHFGLEGIVQRSIGNADTNLDNMHSITGGKKINVEALSLKSDVTYGESTFMLGYSYLTNDNGSHDSLVLPWDGTPLYTNMITSNDLFVSNYGKGLTADSIYIGGTQSFKVAYTQGYDFIRVKGVKTTFSYMLADNDKFLKGKQKDFNMVLSYKYDKHFSIAFKGIFVKNNTSASENDTITQIDDFQQYRVIANYKF